MSTISEPRIIREGSKISAEITATKDGDPKARTFIIGPIDELPTTESFLKDRVQEMASEFVSFEGRRQKCVRCSNVVVVPWNESKLLCECGGDLFRHPRKP